MTHPIQVILTRQLAAYLGVPVFLVDPDGNLLFYNEPAEAIYGKRFDETGPTSFDDWWSAFPRFEDDGTALRREDHPLIITLAEKRPAYKCYSLRGLDGVVRRLEVTSIPITGLQGELLAAIAIFWELRK